MKPCRPYQLVAKAALLAAITAGLRPCLVLPCGGGKTHTMSAFISDWIEIRQSKNLSHRVLWIAHRRELIDQAAEKLIEFGLPVGRIMAGEPVNLSRTVQVASIQTLARRDKPPADLIIIDEQHHATSASYAAIMELYPNAIIGGCTATPFRTDGRGLGAVADELIVGARVQELVDQGFLINPTVFAPSKVLDLKGVGTSQGDFDRQALGFAVDKRELIGDIVNTWKKQAAGLRTICFAVNKEHSRHICEAFRAEGIKAEHLDDSCSKDDRRNALRRLAQGHTQVICNVDLFGEGVDIPVLEVVIQARPTQSLGLHQQQVGRCMRIAPGKTFAIVLDHAGNHNRHGFITDHVDFSLKDRVVKKSANEAAGPAVKQCPKCYALVAAGASVCRAAMPSLVGLVECGYVFTVESKEIVEKPGELVQVNSETLFRIEKPVRATLTPEQKAAKEAAAAKRKAEIHAQFAERQARLNRTDCDDTKQVLLARWISEQRDFDFKPNYPWTKYFQRYGHWPTKAMKESAAARIETEQQRAAS